jgi:hypothetical protein
LSRSHSSFFDSTRATAGAMCSPRATTGSKTSAVAAAEPGAGEAIESKVTSASTF